MSATYLPGEQYAKQGWDILGRDFSLGTANPLQVVIDGPADSPQVRQAVAHLEATLRQTAASVPLQTAIDKRRTLTVVSTTLAGDPAGEGTQRVVKHLRDVVVPQSFAGVPAKVYVAGNTAGVVDYLAFFHTWLPIALVVVLGLSFILLLRGLPLGGDPGQGDRHEPALGGGRLRPDGARLPGGRRRESARIHQGRLDRGLGAALPLRLLFGLSMDYQVFLLSRIKERFDETGDTREAVGYGVGRTAGIITGAAAIMVSVFAGMASGRLVMFQQMGFGLAVAVLVDATVVRTIIVPATMELLGDWNWYLPRWLQWLPDVSVEGHAYEPQGQPGATVPEPRPQPDVHREPGLALRRPIDEREPAGS